MEDQFVTVVLQPNDRHVRVKKKQKLGIISQADGPLLKETAKVKKEFTLPGYVRDFEEVPSSSSNMASSSSTSTKAFKMPAYYVHYHGEETGSDLEVEAIEYDLDREDSVWLKMQNERRVRERRKPLSEALLEKCMDRLEKESHFQQVQSSPLMRQHQHSAHLDGDAVCCICNDDDTSDANQIIFCDMCNIAVHQECYGVPYIPEGQWLCRRCQLSPSAPVKCALCPFTNGAFKQTSDGLWAHVICAIWLSEVHFANTAFLEPIEGVGHSLRRRCKLKCLVCKKAKMGACLQCSKRSCTRSFHVTCAFYAGMRMVIQEESDRKSGALTLNRYVYCSKHSNQEAVADGESKAAWKRRVDEQLRKARRQLQASNKEARAHVPIPVIPPKKVNAIRSELGLDNIKDICYYWALKRKSRCGVPLIRRLQVYHTKKALGQGVLFGGTSTEVSAGSEAEMPALHSHTSQQPPLKPEHLYTHRLRSNLEKVRLLCELVRKREKLKREYVRTAEEIVTRWTKPLSQVLSEALDKLGEKDHLHVFAEPVNEADAPDYYTIIKRPMDLQTMRSKLTSYKCVTDLKRDFLLMMKNCDTYNHSNPTFWNYGKRIGSMGLKVIEAAAEEEKQIQAASWLAEHSKEISLLSDEGYEHLAVEDHREVGDPPEAKHKRQDERRSTTSKAKQKAQLLNHQPTHTMETAPSSSQAMMNGNSGGSSVRKRKVPGAAKQPAEMKLQPITLNGQIAPSTVSSGVNSLKELRDGYKKSLHKAAGATRRTTRHSYVTDISSASDTAGISSMGEEDEYDAGAMGTGRRKCGYNTRGNVYALKFGVDRFAVPDYRSKPSKPPRQHSSSIKPGHLPISHGMVTVQEHNEIVLAQLDNGTKLPAHIIDVRMRGIDDSKFPYNKAMERKPPGNQHSLIKLFDLANTWKWLPNNRIEHFDVMTHGVAPQQNDAYLRARKFYQEIVHG